MPRDWKGEVTHWLTPYLDNSLFLWHFYLSHKLVLHFAIAIHIFLHGLSVLGPQSIFLPVPHFTSFLSYFLIPSATWKLSLSFSIPLHSFVYQAYFLIYFPVCGFPSSFQFCSSVMNAETKVPIIKNYAHVQEFQLAKHSPPKIDRKLIQLMNSRILLFFSFQKGLIQVIER